MISKAHEPFGCVLFILEIFSKVQSAKKLKKSRCAKKPHRFDGALCLVESDPEGISLIAGNPAVF